MTRFTIFAMGLALLGGTPALAQDCGLRCGNDAPACGAAQPAGELAAVRAELARTATRLAEARKREEAMPAEQRKRLEDARAFLMSKTATGQAVLPTLKADARLLAAAAAQEEKAAGKPTEVSRTLREMSKTYALLAGAMSHAQAAPVGEVPVREARVELDEAAKVWAKVAQQKARQDCCADKAACKAAAKTVAELCPMRETMGGAMKALADAYGLLKKQRQVPGGDVTVSLRDEFTGEAAKLHARLVAAMTRDCSADGGGDCGGCDMPAPAKTAAAPAKPAKPATPT